MKTVRTKRRTHAMPVPRPSEPDASADIAPERDASVDIMPGETNATIDQAKRDIDAGLVDTDMRVTPGLDAARRDDLVPGPGGNPPGRHG